MAPTANTGASKLGLASKFVDAAYVPAAHDVHVAAPPVEYAPLGHMGQPCAPALLYVPAAQLVQPELAATAA